MESYSRAAVERAMKVQEVILRAIAKKITWWQAAEIIGISDRSMRRWRERYEQFGFDGLLDRRHCRPSEKRVPLAVVEQVLGLYRDRIIEGYDIRFKRLSSSQGLSQVRVSQIIQDNQGFIWFGTQNGLNRFDGYKFKIFKHDA